MSPTYEPDLAAFLLSAFTTQELTALLAPLMPGVPARLPTAWVPPAQFAAEAARIVVGDGLATDPAFYAALTRERPRRAADVLALQDAAGVPRTGWRLEPPGGLPTPAPHPPVRGGRFVPVRVAGKGKTATVYQAWDTTLGQWRAVKVLHAGQLEDEDNVRRFLREAHLAATLDHPAVVRILDVGDEPAKRARAVYLVCEWVEGGTLDRRIAQGPVPVSDALHILEPVAEALAQAHVAHSLVHRDVNPRNVLLGPDGRGRLCDFGTAVLVDPTRALTTVGPGGQYAAPEQVEDGPIDGRADVYALTATLAATVAGSTKFTAFYADQPRILPRVPEAVRAPLARLFARGGAFEPEERHATVHEWLEELRQIATPTRRAPPPGGEDRPTPSPLEALRAALRELGADVVRAELAGVVKREVWSPGEVVRTARLTLPAGARPLELAYIPAGSFRMGGTAHGDEQPVHRVTITRPFGLGLTPVTQAQYAAVMEKNPSHFSGVRDAPDRPVERVSWNDAAEFCKRLSASEGVDYRLPTEAEWEYACRAGTTTECWKGDGAGSLAQVGWYTKNSGGGTKPVGLLPANPWGLHDVHGNVWEWCADGQRSYSAADVSDPAGDTAGGGRAIRGGSWRNDAESCRSAYRSGSVVTVAGNNLGFRVPCVLSVPPSR